MPKAKTEADKFVANSFESVLRTQRKGAMLSELSAKIQEATQAVKEHTKQATVTIVLTIAPANGDASAVTVSDEIKTKLPEKPRGSTLFYTTDDNRLVKDDPNQSEMDLTIVKSDDRAVAATA